MEIRTPLSRLLITAMMPTICATTLITSGSMWAMEAAHWPRSVRMAIRWADKTRRPPRIVPTGKGQPSNLRESAEVPQDRRYRSDKRTVLATWPLGMRLANYPMALDQADSRLFVITRYPARLLVFDTTTGKTVQRLPAVGDCDDVFYDKTNKRIYAIGGEDAVSVFEQQDPDHYEESARIITVKGARTGFFSPELDRLFVAVRRQGTQPAAIRIFAPKSLISWTSIDLTGRPLQLHGLGELLPATLTDRFVGAFVVVPANRLGGLSVPQKGDSKSPS